MVFPQKNKSPTLWQGALRVMVGYALRDGEGDATGDGGVCPREKAGAPMRRRDSYVKIGYFPP